MNDQQDVHRRRDDDHPPRPDPLAVDADAIADTLRKRDQWVCWRYKWNDDRGEWTKVPTNVATGRNASATDPTTWASFDDALDYHEHADTDTDGIGFVVHGEDAIVGLDHDDCRDPETGALEPWAEDVLADVPTYAEVSPSGTGLRQFGLGFKPDGKTRADIHGADGHIEMYDTGRYLTVTGHHIDGTPEDVEQVNDAIDSVHAEHIADDTDATEDAPATADGGVQAESPGATLGLALRKRPHPTTTR